MRLGPLICVLVMTGLLAACGDSEKTVYADPATGGRVTVQSGDDVAAPTNLPDFAPLYPGARIESVMDGTSSGPSGGQKGGMVVFSTPDAPARVADFYRQRLDASGLGERSNMNMNGVTILAAAASDDSDRGAQISIAPATEGSGSQVTLIYTNGSS